MRVKTGHTLKTVITRLETGYAMKAVIMCVKTLAHPGDGDQACEKTGHAV